ncbi:MAG: Bax inhibitor-1/YccA family protein [Phenylobacterium sp.]|uniref:Bax inhibitor-1/YccA family protein n=1 Tax=Phenylobacterium sp. TaxID=1871053 RepID=UPI002723BF79|nr:Bax inhibitor-1/YccA family protein [Phenylobacterium sp.]MDO8900234.1 Bax inhibitor-1/YccA family protein [Phenylobacterium sp.]MDP2215466.1 Bax inhibitor-1/YccA family protein [Phenylobacterium sp.]
MSDFNRAHARTIPADRADMSVDAGLRAFMLGVYNKVALGLVLSAALAFVTGQYPPVRDLMYTVTADGRLAGMTVLGMIVAFAPLAVMLFGAFALKNASPKTSGMLYWTIVALIGAGMGVLTLVYTGGSIASTFLITATAFGGLSLFGYTTKKDLTAFGSFLIVGLFGLIIAMVVNMFIQNSMMNFIISVLGVLIFAGLIAFDTQRLKMTYYQLGGDQAAMSVATNYGALSLYINFINLFQFLLAIFGDRR